MITNRRIAFAGEIIEKLNSKYVNGQLLTLDSYNNEPGEYSPETHSMTGS